MHAGEVLALKVSKLAGAFLTAGNDKRIRAWSLKNYELQATLQGHNEAVTTLALDGNFLFSGAEVQRGRTRVPPTSSPPARSLARLRAGRHGAIVGHALVHATWRAARARSGG